jgi:hypothetical protein
MSFTRQRTGIVARTADPRCFIEIRIWKRIFPSFGVPMIARKYMGLVEVVAGLEISVLLVQTCSLEAADGVK